MSMTTPLFGGQAIFGRSVRMKTTNDPSAEQINAFFGLDGVERLHGGLQGRVTLVTGVLAANTPENLRVARETLRSRDDGVARVLVDTVGHQWAWVVFRQLDPGDRILRDSRGYYLPYRAVLRHLT